MISNVLVKYQILARFNPLLLSGIEEDLVHLLEDDSEAIKEGVLHVLEKAGETIREQIGESSRFGYKFGDILKIFGSYF